jgi:hypothetical protein
MDKNKLLYFIKDRGYKIEDFCKAINMSYSNFYVKCRDAKFSLKELWNISDVLQLSIEDVTSIFFVNMVS